MSELALIIIPDPDEAGAAEIFVDGAIGGRPYRFLLDTGAAKTSVLYDATTAAFPRAGQHDSSGVFARHADDLIAVPSIEIGPIVRRDFTLVRATPGEPLFRSAIVGMDLLRDYCCHFFFDEKRVTLDQSPAADDDAAFHDLLMDARFHPYVRVRLGARQAQAVWDTGAGLTIVDLRVIEANPAHFTEAGESSGTDSTGATQQTPMFVMAETMIGGYVFPPQRVAGVDLSHVNATIEIPMDMILGYNTLSKAHWLFDFPRRRWAITRRLTG